MSSGDGAGTNPGANKKLVLLIPLVGVVLVIAVVALAVIFGDAPKAENDPKGPRPRREKPTDMTKLYDGTAPGADDPNLKDGGNGLKYRDLVVGDGAEVPDAATVMCDYTGWLLDGSVFDSSWKGPQPITFSLMQVVKGWGMGIPGMKVGGIRKLVIPAHLGYGDDGKGDIPPRATLVFEVQVLELKDDKGGGMPSPHGGGGGGRPGR